MGFVPVRTEDRQAMLPAQRARDVPVRQLTRITHAIRVHPGAFGIVAPKGVHNIGRRLAMAGDAALPEPARQPVLLWAGPSRDTHRRVDAITAEIKARARTDPVARRRQTMPGIGPVDRADPLGCQGRRRTGRGEGQGGA
jgi:transposase